jgi:uncharacterized damage-inducible protein DinB
VERQKWFDNKFRFELSQDNYDLILNRLKENPDKISRLVSSLHKSILTNKVDDHWSIQENVGHLIDLEELHDGRIDDFIAGKEVLRPADLNNRKTEEANHNNKNISELLVRLKMVRENFIDRMKNLDKEILTRSSIHPRLKQPMRPIDMAQFVLEHDEHHIQNIKEIISDLH